MYSVASEISRSIKEGKWLYIEYNNTSEKRITYFWAAVLDIDPNNKKLKVDLFNQDKGWDVLTGTLYFTQILKAEVIEGTHYTIQKELINKIIHNYTQFDFLEYSGINERILHYYRECYENDRDGIIKKYTLVNGIDADIFKGQNFPLNPEQFEQFVKYLKLKHKKSNISSQAQLITMAINVLSITDSKGLYPLVYKDLLLDIRKKELTVSTENHFNLRIKDMNDSTKFDLKNIYDGDINDFIINYDKNKELYISDLIINLKRDQKVDERPYVFKFERYLPINIRNEYNQIEKHFTDGTLCAPLKTFFGMIEKKRKRKGKSILIENSNINLDQIRTIFNAMVNDITFVQGPPGTGKTQTIINVILSSLLNHSTCLITSNNNEAINNIVRKCFSFTYQGRKIPFNLLRLGSNRHIKETLKFLKQSLDEFQKQNIKIEKNEIKNLESEFMNWFSFIQSSIENYEQAAELKEQLDSLNEVIHEIEGNKNSDEISQSMALLGIKDQIFQIESQLKKLPNFKWDNNSLNLNQEKIMRYIYLRSMESYQKLNTSSKQDLKAILEINDTEEQLQSFRHYIGQETNLKKLLDCFPFIISTNISCAKLGPANPSFDLLIMDEASQCSNSVALLAMARCKRALFVGDQNQLQPVSVISETKNEMLIRSYDIPEHYNYKKNSILSTLLKIDPISKFILLHQHYRCHNKIIGFSNKKYYGNELELCSALKNRDALKLIQVDSSKNNDKNTSKEEVQAIIEEIKQSSNPDIAVISPFYKQASLLEEELEKNHLNHVKVGTVHTFQGNENTKVILSSGISKATHPSSYHWLKNNQELLNVATTRAKENLVLVTDTDVVEKLSKEPNDFLDLVHYIQKDGEVQIQSHQNDLFTSKVKNFKYFNTQAEEEFLKTLMHLKSIYGQLNVHAKVKVSDVLQLDPQQHQLFKYGNQAHFDFVIYDLEQAPLVAIEVMGAEHYSHQKVIERDKKKQLICKNHNLALITIKNDYVRRYSFIKETIMNTIKK